MRRTACAQSLSLAAALALLLAGCASAPHYSGGRHYAAGRPHYTVAPYQVNGVWYYPRVDYDYDRTGTASWYGPGFDGRATADGEIYDMNDLTAAHKTLPLPSVVAVTNLANGRELTLRVNDRGPFVGDRVIDVSRRAAQLLGFERAGTAPVRVRVLKEPSIEVAAAAMRGETGPTAVATARQAGPVALAAAPPPQPAPPPLAPPRVAEIVAPPPVAEPPPRRLASARNGNWLSPIASAQAATFHPPDRAIRPFPPPRPIAPPPERIFIQAGAFSVPANARWVKAQIGALGSADIVAQKVHGIALYRVRLGPVRSDAEALRLLSAVLERGFAGARLVEE